MLFYQSTQNFGGGFEHRPEPRVVYLSNVFSQMIDDFLEALFHLLNMMFGIAVCVGDVIDAPWLSIPGGRCKMPLVPEYGD
jgi:hypothetical protein